MGLSVVCGSRENSMDETLFLFFALFVFLYSFVAVAGSFCFLFFVLFFCLVFFFCLLSHGEQHYEYRPYSTDVTGR